MTLEEARLKAESTPILSGGELFDQLAERRRKEQPPENNKDSSAKGSSELWKALAHAPKANVKVKASSTGGGDPRSKPPPLLLEDYHLSLRKRPAAM